MPRKVLKKNTKVNKVTTKKIANKTSKPIQSLNFSNEWLLVFVIAISVLMFLSNIGFCGVLGIMIREILYSIMGVISLVFPFFVFIWTIIKSNREEKTTIFEIFGIFILTIAMATLIEIIFQGKGGNIAENIVVLLQPIIATAGIVLLQVTLIILVLVFLTRKPILTNFTKKSIQTTDKITTEALNMAKRKGEDFSKHLEEVKMEQRIESIKNNTSKISKSNSFIDSLQRSNNTNINDSNIYNDANAMNYTYDSSNQIRNILLSNSKNNVNTLNDENVKTIQDTKDSVANTENSDNKNIENDINKDLIINNNNFSFPFFRSNKKAVTSDSKNIVHFNEDIKPKLKKIVEDEKDAIDKNSANKNENINFINNLNNKLDIYNKQNNYNSNSNLFISLNDSNVNIYDKYKNNKITNTKDILTDSTENLQDKEINKLVNNIIDLDIDEKQIRTINANTSNIQEITNTINAQNAQNYTALNDNIDNTFNNRYNSNMANGSIEDVIRMKNEEFSQNEYKNALEGYRPKPIYVFPSLDYLEKSKNDNNVDLEYLNTKGLILQKTLEQFGVGAKLVDKAVGPAVTRFELQPEIGVRVSKITSLEDDLKLALAAKDIRIEAPIPGKQAIGIEIPNTKVSMVYLGDLLSTDEFQKAKSTLTVALGKDIAGNNIYCDLAKMPHLLIAGATGSGKSICINSIVMSLVYKSRPEDVQLIMIDPKVVELQCYNNIPHLYTDVVTDPVKAKATLSWAVNEMMNRYKIFAEKGVKNIDGYNKIADTKMPKIVIIIDELADLMMAASKEVENSIVHIAQLARACGMHLIVATQRPMASVVTGLIKANIPSRIAFAVSSGLDSRIILDMQGAEKLLGKGDMLYYPTGATKPIRVQGCYISEEEIDNALSTIKIERSEKNKNDEIAKYIQKTTSDVEEEQTNTNNNLDELFIDCGLLAISLGTASAGNFQRKFKIGFNRAARIIDELEENGVIGPQEGKKPREVLMTEEEFNERFL